MNFFILQSMDNVICLMDTIEGILATLKSNGFVTQYNFNYELGKNKCGDISVHINEFLRNVKKIDKFNESNEEVAQDWSTQIQTCVDLNKVQIKADKQELDRRIQCFMKRKRLEANDTNLQEFCRRFNHDSETNSCARVDATVMRKPGSKGHIKVSRVVNRWGPQLQVIASGATTMQSLSSDDTNNDCTLQNGIQERLNNMESHIKLYEGQTSSVPKNVYERLRNLEERILFLEGLSPDYFHEGNILKCINSKLTEMKSHKSSASQKLSLSEINSRIADLRESLQNKMTRS